MDETVQRSRHDNTAREISHTAIESSLLSTNFARNTTAPFVSPLGIRGVSHQSDAQQSLSGGSQNPLHRHRKLTPPSGVNGNGRAHALASERATDPVEDELGLNSSQPSTERIRMIRLGSQSGTEEDADLDVFENLVLDGDSARRNSTPINHQDRLRFSETPFTDHGRFGRSLRRSTTLKSIGEAVRQVGRRVVDLRIVDDDQEEAQPLRLPDRMDVDGGLWDPSNSSHDDESIGSAGDVSWTGADQADQTLRQVGSEGVPLTASPDDKAPPGIAHTELPKTPLNGRSLGMFGPRNKFRLALYHTLKRPYVRTSTVASLRSIWLTIIVLFQICSYTESCVLVLLIVHVVVLLFQSASTLEAPRIDDGYFDSWEDTALLVIFVLYTLEAMARIITTGLIFDPKMTVPIMSGSSESREASQPRLYLERLVWLWRGKAEQNHEKKSAAAGLQRNVSAVHPSSLIKRHIRAQQAWRANHTSEQVDKSKKEDTGRLAGHTSDTRKGKILDELPFEAALQRQIRIVVSGRPYLRHSWQYVLRIACSHFRTPSGRERSYRHQN